MSDKIPEPSEQYLLDGSLLVEVTVVTATEVEYRTVNDADAIALGWGKTSGGYEAVSGIDDFMSRAEAVDAAPDHGPLAAHLSERTLAKVLSRPAHVPLSEMKSTRVFGFNVVTISPQGIPGGPRLDGVVSRQRAQDELDELEPFMVDGWKTVMVELREVTS